MCEVMYKKDENALQTNEVCPERNLLCPVHLTQLCVQVMTGRDAGADMFILCPNPLAA